MGSYIARIRNPIQVRFPTIGGDYIEEQAIPTMPKLPRFSNNEE
jgi:hypothetical protein